MRRLVVVVAAAAAVLLAGCAALEGAREVMPVEGWGPYQDAYDQWTRHDSIHRDLGLVLEADATLRSPQFQEAYLRRYARLYNVREGELERLLAADRELTGRELRFVLVAQTGDRKWNDFDKPDSIWRIYLQNERGERLPLTSRRRLEKRTELAGFFRLGPWDEVYELSFDLTGEEAKDFSTRRLTLILASVLGEAQFSWDAMVVGRQGT